MTITALFALEDRGFIIGAYRMLLNRDPDDSGLSKYLSDLSLGISRTTILADIAGSREAAANGTLAKLSDADAKFIASAQQANQSGARFLGFASFDSVQQRISLLEEVIRDLSHLHKNVLQSNLIAGAEPIVYAVRITGGLGDAAIIARFMRDFQQYIQANAQFDVFFHSPDVIPLFFGSVQGFRVCLKDQLFSEYVREYDFSLLANQFITFANEHIKKERLIRRAPKVLETFYHIENVRKPIERYIVNHPNFDGAFADLAIKTGHKRYTYLHHMAGIDYGGNKCPLSPLGEVPAEIRGRPYLTIHDGWDNKFDFRMSVERPTKTLPSETWESFVMDFKALHKDILIVQIGGAAGKKIPGVDFCFKGTLQLSESLAILSSSLLHVDTESGLVHIAASLGVRSVVLFGPTNIQWFGYPENVNVPPQLCGNCWWSTETWMEKCPANHAKPVCMDRHKAGDLARTVSNLFLSERNETRGKVPV